MPSQNTQCLYQARQVREGEVVVAKAQGVSLYQLMERAGARGSGGLCPDDGTVPIIA